MVRSKLPIKRIAFDARYISDRYHGIGRYAFQLLQSIITLAPDYSFVLYRGDDPDQRFEWDNSVNRPNVTVREGPKPIYWPHEQVLWSFYIKRDGIDLFHTPYFAVPLLTGVPVIMTVHDMIFERYPQYMPRAWMRPYYTLLMTLGLRKARKIITVSKNTANELKYYYEFSMDKLVIGREGVGYEFSPTQDPYHLESVRNKYGLASPFILSVGARRPHKNYGRLIRVFSNLSKNYPHSLVLIGSEDVRFNDEVLIEVNKSGLGKRVKLLNWVPEEDLPTIYSLAELVVLPSIHEGFGLPAVEAMACGTPVIAANNSSFPEVLEGAGILVDPYDMEQIEDAIRLLLDNEDKRIYYKRAGFERSVEFSWKKAAEHVLEIYNEIIE